MIESGLIEYQVICCKKKITRFKSNSYKQIFPMQDKQIISKPLHKVGFAQSETSVNIARLTNYAAVQLARVTLH